jgi:SAM-dependent methyltransferase
MGVFTREGKIAAGMGGKFRQINRFLETLDDIYGASPPEKIKAVDFGCGKSYLTFLVYHYFTRILGAKAEITGLDLKSGVIGTCSAAAARYGYEGLSFKQGDIADCGNLGADLLISLHACDTATDHALFNAVKNGIPVIFAVPCCQHELNSQVAPASLKLLARHGVIRERAAALLTDALRANLLTAAGYKTQLLEFIDLEHTPKNIMIRAVKAAIPGHKRNEAMDEARAAISEFGVDPTLMRLFADAGILGK